MKIAYIMILLLVAAPAIAQQSTALDRISSAWGQCLGSFQQQLDEIAEIRKQLVAASTRIKELEAELGKKESK